MRLKRRTEKSQTQDGAPPWMVTYSDMVTLILVFFILLFAMSKIDIAKFEALAESLKGYQFLDYYPSIIPGKNPSDSEKNVSSDDGEGDGPKTLEGLYSDIKQYLEENDLWDVIVANRTERGVVLVLQEQVLFATGEAEIAGGSNAFLDKVGTLLHDIPNLVKVEGHTDDRPITTYRYPSNWELSTARAGSVIRYLVEKHGLDSKRFIAVGYGETRPVVPNDTPKNMQKNRRVEIVIADPEYTEDDLIDH